MHGIWKIMGMVLAAGTVLFAAVVIWCFPKNVEEFNAFESSTGEGLESPVLVSQTNNESPEVVEEQPGSQDDDPPEAEVEVPAEQTVEPEPERQITPGTDKWLDALLESEPVDPDWSPRMEATLDGIIIASGLLAYTEAEVELQCRTSICRAHVVHLEGYDRDAFKAILEDELRPMMFDLISSEYPRVQQFGASTLHSTPLSELPGGKSQTSIYIFKSMPIMGPSSP